MYGTPTGEWEQPDSCYWGGLFVMPRSVYRDIGGMDAERFPLRHADTDYAVRAAKAGYWLGRTDVVVEHRDPSTSTLFMDRDAVAAEYGRLFEVHGEFPVYGWGPELWR
jgi:GT2 family glycosyltransferase